MGVADQRALHVVDAEAINHAVFDHGIRLVTNPGEEIFLASVRCIHVAIEHEAAPAARAFPARNHVGAAFLYLLPCDLKAHTSPRGAHVLRHVCFFARRAGNVYDVAAHGHDFFFANLGENFLDQFRVDSRDGTFI